MEEQLGKVAVTHSVFVVRRQKVNKFKITN